MTNISMDARYTGIYQLTPEQHRQETAAYYQTLHAAQKRKALANAYWAQHQHNQRVHPKQEYRCERCGI